MTQNTFNRLRLLVLNKEGLVWDETLGMGFRQDKNPCQFTTDPPNLERANLVSHFLKEGQTTNVGPLTSRIKPTDALTFWGSFQYLRFPEVILANARQFAFIHLPVFKNRVHTLNSPYFRSDGYGWYFTEPGLTKALEGEGFELLLIDDLETTLGRAGTKTYVFRRNK